jgi:predicted transcriptional regulator
MKLLLHGSDYQVILDIQEYQASVDILDILDILDYQVILDTLD